MCVYNDASCGWGLSETWNSNADAHHSGSNGSGWNKKSLYKGLLSLTASLMAEESLGVESLRPSVHVIPISLLSQLLWYYPTKFNKTLYKVRMAYAVVHISMKYWSSKVYGNYAHSKFVKILINDKNFRDSVDR